MASWAVERKKANRRDIAIGVIRQGRAIARPLHQVVGEFHQIVSVLFGYPEDGQNHPNREWCGHLLNPIATTSFDEPINQFGGNTAGRVLPRSGGLRSEHPRHDPSQTGVIGGVGVDQ